MRIQLQRHGSDRICWGNARRARFVMPTTAPGRPSCRRPDGGVVAEWPNRDPIAERGGLNLYGYVQNAPTSFYDPDGRGVVPIVIGGAAIWQAACARYAATKALDTFTDDKKQHCMAHCLRNRCTGLGAPAVGQIAGLLWELRPGGVFDWGDLVANQYGINASYNLLRSCKSSCDKCPL
jgi:hypothetical protein